MKTQRRKITKPLSVRLTDEEVLKYGREAARAVADASSIEKEFDSIKKDYKARIDEQSSIVAKLSPRIHSSQETRDVECEEVKNWTKGTVVVTRLDTGEMVESRPMREDEKQMEVQLGDEQDVVTKEREEADRLLKDKTDVQPDGDADVAGDGGGEPDGDPDFDLAEPEAESGDAESNPFA